MPLDWAVEYGRIEIARLLRAAGGKSTPAPGAESDNVFGAILAGAAAAAVV